MKRIKFGSYIKAQRVKQKLGLREVARRLRINHGSLSQIENNVYVPNSKRVVLHARALGIDEDFLLKIAHKNIKRNVKKTNIAEQINLVLFAVIALVVILIFVLCNFS